MAGINHKVEGKSLDPHDLKQRTEQRFNNAFKPSSYFTLGKASSDMFIAISGMFILILHQINRSHEFTKASSMDTDMSSAWGTSNTRSGLVPGMTRINVGPSTRLGESADFWLIDAVDPKLSDSHCPSGLHTRH